MTTFIISGIIFLFIGGKIFNAAGENLKGLGGILSSICLYLQVVALYACGGDLFSNDVTFGQTFVWWVGNFPFLWANILGGLTGWAMGSTQAYIAVTLVFSIAQTAILSQGFLEFNILVIVAKYGVPILNAIYTIIEIL